MYKVTINNKFGWDGIRFPEVELYLSHHDINVDSFTGEFSGTVHSQEFRDVIDTVINRYNRYDIPLEVNLEFISDYLTDYYLDSLSGVHSEYVDIVGE